MYTYVRNKDLCKSFFKLLINKGMFSHLRAWTEIGD